MAPEEAEPPAEAIDQRRIEASAKVVVEQEPLAMAAEVEVHEHAEEPAEEMQDDSEKCPDGMCAEEKPATMAAVKPASKPVVKPKSLIR
jgi:hypothetical protein